jgi:hypothetical protein
MSETKVSSLTKFLSLTIKKISAWLVWLGVRFLYYFYKGCISPFLTGSCRYHPTCSDYWCECVRRFGLWRGCWLGIGRLLRCNPFCSCTKGGVDLPPELVVK